MNIFLSSYRIQKSLCMTVSLLNWIPPLSLFLQPKPDSIAIKYMYSIFFQTTFRLFFIEEGLAHDLFRCLSLSLFWFLVATGYYRLRVVYPKAVIVLEPELVTELELEKMQ